MRWAVSKAKTPTSYFQFVEFNARQPLKRGIEDGPQDGKESEEVSGEEGKKGASACAEAGESYSSSG
jgi:hypothetical protein